MGTFTGDLLRMLAHSGLQVGATALGTALAIPWKEKAEARQLGLKELLKAAGTAPESAMPAIAEGIRTLSKGQVNLPTYTGPSQVLTPGGEKLNITPTQALEPGYSQEATQRFVRPPVSLSEMLGAITQQKPQFAEAILGIKGGQSTEAQEAAAQLRALAEQRKAEHQDWQRGFSEYKQGVTEEKNALSHQARMAQLNQQLQALEFQRYKLDQTSGQRQLQQDETNALKLIKDIEARAIKLKDIADPAQQLELANRINIDIENGKLLFPKQFENKTKIPIGTQEAGVVKKGIGAIVNPILGTKIGEPKQVPFVSGGEAAIPAGPTVTDPVSGKVYKEGDVYKGKKLRVVNGVLGY